MRDRRVMRFGALFAAIALYLQLAIVSLGPLPVASDTPIGALGEHALCLADGGTPPQPADDAPAAPVHDHTLFCCLWHSLSGVAPHAAPTPLPVNYVTAALDKPRDAALTAAPRHKPANARAPPPLA
jgi:hypothetical protein